MISNKKKIVSRILLPIKTGVEINIFVDRSLRCLFESTEEVDVLLFVDLIGTCFRRELVPLSLQVRFDMPIIRDAVHKKFKNHRSERVGPLVACTLLFAAEVVACCYLHYDLGATRSSTRSSNRANS